MLHDVRRNGFRILLIEGAAGIGKTELVARLREELFTDRRVVAVAARPDQPSYRTASELVQRATGRSWEPPTVFAGDAHTGRARAEVSAERRDATQPAVAALVDALQRRVDVLVVDDAHWLDDASAELLADLADAATDAAPETPALLVLCHRPVAPDSSIGSTLERLRRLRVSTARTLRPLDEADCVLAIEQLGVLRPSPAYVSIVYRACQGNPLLLRAAVETLQGRGVPADLRADDRRTLGTMRVEDIVDDPVRNWVDRLAADHVAPLAAAAVFGPELTVDELAEVAAVSRDDAADALDDALAAGVLRSDGVLFWFSHPLLRAELDRRLSTRARQDVHARCARLAWAERRRDGAAVARAAEHALVAGGRIEPDLRYELFDAARQWSAERAAWGEASRFAQGALDAADALDLPPRRRLELRLAAAEAAFFDDNSATALELIGALVDEAERLDAASLWGRALLLQARLRNNFDAGAWKPDVDTRALERYAEEATDPRTRSLASELLAEVASTGGRLEEATHWAETAVRRLGRDADARARSLAFGALGYARLAALDFAGAEDGYGRAAHIAREAGDGWLACTMTARLAFVAHPTGRFTEAVRFAETAQALARARRDFSNEGLAEAVLAQMAASRGDFGALERHAARARANGLRSEYPLVLFLLYPAQLYAAHASGDRARIAALLEDWEATQPGMVRTIARYRRRLLERTLYTDLSPLHHRQRVQTTVGLVCLDLATASGPRSNDDDGDTPDGMEAAFELLRWADDRGVAFAFTWPASVARIAADTAARHGAVREAEELYQRARAQCHEAGAYLELARVHLGLARIASQHGDRDLLRHHAATAHRLGEQLGFDWLTADAATLNRRSIDAPLSTADGGEWRAVLMSDVVGSTDVSVRLGDIAYHRLVSEHHRVVRSCLQRFGGHEFSEGGDSLLAWFADADAAAACALAIGDELGADAAAGTAGAAGSDPPPTTRVGLAGGYPLMVEGRPYGAVVNLAARIAAEAGPGEVLASDAVAKRTTHRIIDRRERVLKGFPGVQRLHRLRATAPGAVYREA